MHRFKSTLQFLMRPLARRVVAQGGTANQVTSLALAGSALLGGVLMLTGSWLSMLWLLLPVWMMTRMALNALDGVLAREHGQQSRLGAYFNELADVVSDAALILPLVTLPGFRTSLVVVIALLASWTELAGVLGDTVGASRRFDGPMGKADRALVLGALGAWVGLMGRVPPWPLFLQWALILLLVFTVLRRVSYGLSEAGGAR